MGRLAPNAPRSANQGHKRLPISARLFSGVRLPARLWRLAPAIACVALAACGMHQTPGESSTGELFARGIEQITDLYIDPISSQKVVFVGATNLTKLDSRLSLSFGGDLRDREQMTLSQDGTPIVTYRVPPDIDSSAGGEII